MSYNAAADCIDTQNDRWLAQKLWLKRASVIGWSKNKARQSGHPIVSNKNNEKSSEQVVEKSVKIPQRQSCDKENPKKTFLHLKSWIFAELFGDKSFLFFQKNKDMDVQTMLNTPMMRVKVLFPQFKRLNNWLIVWFIYQLVTAVHGVLLVMAMQGK